MFMFMVTCPDSNKWIQNFQTEMKKLDVYFLSFCDKIKASKEHFHLAKKRKRKK